MHDVNLHLRVMKRHEELAASNRDLLRDLGVRAVNMMGAVGSGKTSLIEAIVRKDGRPERFAAVTGDVAGDDDARRLSSLGVRTRSIETGDDCHLDAHRLGHALSGWDLSGVTDLFVENVGNLVCPADFPLGTTTEIVVISVTEGDDMVRKHPKIFLKAEIAVLNKIDLAEPVGVDPGRIIADLEALGRPSPLLTDARRGRGIEELMRRLGIA